MDQISDIIDLHALVDLVLFLAIGYFSIWLFNKVRNIWDARSKKK